MASTNVSVSWRAVFFIAMLLMASNVSSRKLLDANIPVEDGFNVEIGASSFFYELEGELEKRFESFIKSHTDNDVPRGGNY
ncbi:hypothetical protein SDJN03_05414, partial [Cucurbita argyrosperma subsp. sororia]